MSIAQEYRGGGVIAIRLTGAVSAANAGLGAFLNPEGKDLIITRTTFVGIHNSDGAANLGIGVTTVAAKATDILNDLAMAAVAGNAYNGATIQPTAKTQISAPAVWEDDKYITFTGSADTTGLDAILYVEYLPMTAA